MQVEFKVRIKDKNLHIFPYLQWCFARDFLRVY